MKRILSIALGILAVITSQAQQKEGKVTYERTSQMQVSFAGMNEEMQRLIPKTRVDKFELNFANNQSVWKQAPSDDDGAGTFSSEGGGMQIKMVAGGSDDVTYMNFDSKRRVDQRELFDKKFVIIDSVPTKQWKVSGETKMILGHPCMKATSTLISTRSTMTMDDGKMQRKEVVDTANVEAWFASDIPVSAGPAEYQGQLPGLILEINVKDGRQVFKAIEIKPKAETTMIKEPTAKKTWTPAEFKKEQNKMLENMQMNGGGNGRRIIMN
jgi:GLPGLI family protein